MLISENIFEANSKFKEAIDKAIKKENARLTKKYKDKYLIVTRNHHKDDVAYKYFGKIISVEQMVVPNSLSASVHYTINFHYLNKKSKECCVSLVCDYFNDFQVFGTEDEAKVFIELKK